MSGIPYVDILIKSQFLNDQIFNHLKVHIYDVKILKVSYLFLCYLLLKL